MATKNPFDLLGDDDNDDPSQLIATAQQQKVAAAASATAGGKKASAPAAAAPTKPAKLPTKPTPPTQAVRESRNEGGRGGGRGTGRGSGRGRGGYYRESGSNENTFSSDNGFSGGEMESGRPSERRPYAGPRGGFRGGRRGGFSNEEGGEGERPRRVYDRRSGSGRGSDFKRDGAGRGNWGTAADEIPPVIEEPVGENETNAPAVEKQPNEEENVDADKENPANETEEKEPEEKQMTLEEYEKVLEEKRKALLPSKTEERKVDTKEFETMQLISKKKDDDEVFIKLGSEKDKRREAAEKEERAKKVSINEFLKPADGEGYYRSGGRGSGRGRGRGSRGGYGGNNPYNMAIPKIEDPGQFPSLGAK